jgi:hypothetical protein
MSRRNVLAALGLFVVALLIAVTVYVSNLRAADSPASIKPPATPVATDQIKQLQDRIALLEQRIATLEKGGVRIWAVSPSAPNSKVAPPLNWFPAPPPADAPKEKDGFPPARILFIDGKQTPTNGNPGR